MPCRDGVSAEEHHDAVIHANELTYEQGLSTGGIIRYFAHAFSLNPACCLSQAACYAQASSALVATNLVYKADPNVYRH